MLFYTEINRIASAMASEAFHAGKTYDAGEAWSLLTLEAIIRHVRTSVIDVTFSEISQINDEFCIEFETLAKDFQDLAA